MYIGMYKTALLAVLYIIEYRVLMYIRILIQTHIQNSFTSFTSSATAVSIKILFSVLLALVEEEV